MNQKGYSGEFLEQIKTRFPGISFDIYSPRRVYVLVAPDQAYSLARFFFEEHGLRFSIATGVDTRSGIEVLYHFSHDPSGTYYTIKTLLPKDDLKIKSLADFLPAANWIEREIRELLGVEFVGHPNPLPLLTSDDWPADRYPLRRDYREET